MKYQSNEYIKSEEVEWEIAAPGLTRKILGYEDNIMMVRVKFEKGGIGARHKHIHCQTTYVSEGEFEISIGNKKQVLTKGDGFYVPSNIEHEAICLEEGELIDVFSPVREDFL